MSGFGHRVGGEAATTHAGIVQDRARKTLNVAAGRDLCRRCDGTGNELYAMFRACQLCLGSGVANEPEVVAG